MVYTRDGFVIAEGIPEETIEELLEEYYENAQKIQKVGNMELKRGFFGGIVESEAMQYGNLLCCLAARQFWIKQFLMGQTDLNQGTEEIESDKLVNIAGFVEQMFYRSIYSKKGVA